jgi:gliding motility-associated-like protein
MRKPTLLVILSWLLTITALAQQSRPNGKPSTDPTHPGTWSDSMRLEIEKARAEYVSQELAQRPKPPILTKTKSKSKILSGGCNVKASFTPGNDTTLYTGQVINFTNTSQNADSYEWFVDVYNHYNTTDLNNFVPSIGVTPVMLVANNGDCTDTAITYVVRNGTPPTDPKRMNISYGLPNRNEWVSCMAADKTDGYLLAGVSGIYDQNGYNEPYFVRVSETGCILWSKLLPAELQCSVRAMLATYDGGFVMQVILPDNFDKSYLLKLDKNGNILWTHSYQGNLPLNIVDNIKELSDHSLMVLSGPWSGRNLLLTSLTETGAFLWQKQYLFNSDDFGRFSDLVEKSGSLYLSASYYQLVDANTNNWNEFPMLFKVDAATGNLQWWKGYTSPNKYYFSSGIHFYKDGLILNGFADSMINAPTNKWSNFQTLLETDLDGNVREGKLIMNPIELDAPIGNNLIVDENNNLEVFFSGTELLDLQPGLSQQSFYLRLDASKDILWQQVYFGYTIPQLAQAVGAPQKGMAMIGERMTSLFNPFYGFSENLVLIKVDSNGTAADQFCDQYTAFTSVQDMMVTPYSPGTPVVTNNVIQVVDQNISSADPNSELRYHCPEYVPLCSFMKLSGKNFVCSLKDTLEFVAHMDPSCGDPVKWTYDINNIKTTFQDGSKTRLLFKTPGRYTILAEKPFPCTDIRDSILVTVAPGVIDFNLGNDTTLCAGDSLTLKPAGKYDQYLWQDGSIMDSLKIKTGGLYHLMVTDSCGNTKSDTIQVNFLSALPIDLGPPRYICPSERLLINPPNQFVSYDWEPKYNMMIPSNGGGVIVFPAVDTTYTLTVANSMGCKGKAQVAIRIYLTEKPSLGNDTALCSGDHVLLTPKGTFVSYTWSDGESTSAIDVENAGSYWVLTSDANQCKTSDTVTLTVYPLPAVRITGGTAICKDQLLTLDAGMGFASYSWQDGSNLEKFNAADTGYYRVQVSDTHQCVASDSIHIADYAESPINFLPTDTTICTYGVLLIQPKESFDQYNWSTGETASAIQVKMPGSYSLQVVNAQGCRGTDSIVVTSKDCDGMLIFPNAFTPNNDGLNDVFRLRYPSSILSYQLQIFNRWGQLIFRSSDPYAGWDGLFLGQLQPAGTYIWMAKFTDHSGKAQMLKGIVVLIR